MVVAPWTGMPPLEPLFAFQIGKNWPSYGLTLYLWESKSTFYFPGGGGTFTLPTFFIISQAETVQF